MAMNESIEWLPYPLEWYNEFFTKDGRWEIKGTAHEFRILQLGNGWVAIAPKFRKHQLTIREAAAYVEHEYRKAVGYRTGRD